MHDDVFKEIRVGDLPADLQYIARELGLEVAVRLVIEFGGGVLSIPREQQAWRPALVRYILNNFNGSNSAMLARKTGFSRSTVYRILRDHNHPAVRPYKS